MVDGMITAVARPPQEGAGSFSSRKKALRIAAFRPGPSRSEPSPTVPLGAFAACSSRSYQPDTQFAFFVDRFILVNLYCNPTEIAKFTSVDVVCGA